MRKYNKNMRIILSGVVIATSTQITTLSYALEDDKIQTTLEENIEEYISKTSNYTKSEVVAVTNEKELIAALENENIKIVEINNDIVMKDLNYPRSIKIKGNKKEIKGNGYTVSSGNIFNLILHTDTKIDNLKLKEVAITSANRENLYIVNHSEISNGEITDCGNITLENVNVNHTMIKSNKNLVINSSKINKSIIKHFGDEVGELKIINTEIKEHHPSSGLIAPIDNGGNKAPIYLYGGNIELENVKIINPGSHAIYAGGSYSKDIKEQRIKIKGILEVDGSQNEAILLKMEQGSNKNIPLELYIDGDIKQKGDSYTIRAENEGTYTKVYYDNSKIEKGTDKWLNAYYNTKNREGNNPTLPNPENPNLQAFDKNQLLKALEDPSIKKVEIMNDIDIKSSPGEPFSIDIKGNEKEIKGNGYTISNSQGSNWFETYANTKIDNLKLKGGTIYTVEGKNLDIVNNSEINGLYISLKGNVSLENVKMNNASVEGNGNLVVKSSKLNNSYISVNDYREKVGIANIINTEINGDYYGAPIRSEGGSVELENIKIINPGDHAIYAKGSKESGGKVRVKGTLEIDGAKKDVIVLKKGDKSSIESPVKLYIDGDIKQKGDTYTVKAEKEGDYTKVYYDESKIKRVIDKWSHVYYSTKTREGNEPQSIVYSNKLVGDDRYKTAVKVSNEGWNNASDVVIVNSNSIVDALSATPFAHLENAPILLTEANKLNSETKKEISRLKARNVYIIGGGSVVSDSVINELKSMNLTVERISGNDRYETSLAVAKKLNEWSSHIQEIAVVNGVTGLSDAISIAPVAAEKRMAILLSSPNEGTKIFDQYIKDNRVSKSYVIGSEAAISNEIANKLPNPERLGGIDRNETNAVILEKFYTSEELNNMFIAKDGMKNPNDLIDALSVGVLASRKNSPVVIVGSDLNAKQESLLSKRHPKEITQVGGNGNENAFNKLVNMFKN